MQEVTHKHGSVKPKARPCQTRSEWREVVRVDPSDLQPYRERAETNSRSEQE